MSMLKARDFSTKACLCKACNIKYISYRGNSGYTALYVFDGKYVEAIRFGKQKEYPCDVCGNPLEETEWFTTRDYQCQTCGAPFIAINYNGKTNVYEYGDKSFTYKKRNGSSNKCRYCGSNSQLPNEWSHCVMGGE